MKREISLSTTSCSIVIKIFKIFDILSLLEQSLISSLSGLGASAMGEGKLLKREWFLWMRA
jgi:hypothetical protein